MPENESVKAPFSIYSNAIEFGLSGWDVRFIIKEVTDGEAGQTVVKKHGTIVMSPGHAKAALEALQNTISLYEQKFGFIDIARIKEQLKENEARSA